MEKLQRRSVGPVQVFQNDQKRLLCSKLSQQLREIPLQSCLELGCIGARRHAIAIAWGSQCREKVRQLAKTSSCEKSEPARIHVPEERHKCVRKESVRNACLYSVCTAGNNLPSVLLYSFGCSR